MKKLIYLFALFSIFAFASCEDSGIQKKQRTFSFDDGPNCQKGCCSGSKSTEEVETEEVETEEVETEEVASKQCCSATKEVASEETAD